MNHVTPILAFGLGVGIAIGLGAVCLVLILWVVSIYNGLVKLRTRVRAAWSQIDVQLKRRHDLIPNLVETVKGYAGHEKETLENVIAARGKAVNAAAVGPAQSAAAESFLGGALGKLLALSEAYPDLKANQNFQQLSEELTSTENKIGFARQHYNECVRQLNESIQVFPNVIFAGMFGFGREEYYELEDKAEKEVPEVEF
ncbi:MAG: LemA family protein [Phycisphaerae bacterium]|nr:LemA family protein [Phycisphaerae bacterium]